MAKAVGVEELVREALQRALADPAPRQMHGTKAKPGIFLSSAAAAKAAAQQCLELRLLEKRGEVRTKAKTTPLYGIAPAGMAYLLEHDPLRQVLNVTRDGVQRLVQWSTEQQEKLVQVQEQMGRLDAVIRDAARRIEAPDVQQMLAATRQSAAPAGTGASDTSAAAGRDSGDRLPDELLQHLRQHKRQTPLRSLDLPQLYRFAKTRQAQLTLGGFHDALRGLVAARQVRLSPFTQAMYLLPEPECGLLVGREIMYYVEAV